MSSVKVLAVFCAQRVRYELSGPFSLPGPEHGGHVEYLTSFGRETSKTRKAGRPSSGSFTIEYFGTLASRPSELTCALVTLHNA